jgi:hypothetical protein
VNGNVEIGSGESNFVNVAGFLAGAAELRVNFCNIEALCECGARKERQHEDESKKFANAHRGFSSDRLASHHNNEEYRSCLQIVT